MRTPALETWVEGGGHKRGVQREHCDRASCPVCWESWKDRQARTAGERVRAYRQIAGRGPERHFQLSPPPELAAELRDVYGEERALDMLRKRGARLARRFGLYAFGMVLHPWRTRARGAGRYRRGKNYYSPHVHVVGFGALVDAREFHDKSGGWVYKNLTAENGYAEPEVVFAYILDHAGIRAGKQTLSWQGELYGKTFKLVKVTKTEEPEVCACGRECHEYALTIDDEPDMSQDRGIYLRQVWKRTYELARARAGAVK